MASLFLALLGAACSSDGATVPTATPDASSPTVSFANDVLPIFKTSCAFSSCHGSTTRSQGGIYLGTQGAEVYANLVGVASSGLPTMVRVKPGDPANSFLLHRIDGDATSLAGCTATTCNELMPQGGPPLEQARLLAIRAWISQGARNDLPDTGRADAGASVDAGDVGEAGTTDAKAANASDAAGD